MPRVGGVAGETEAGPVAGVPGHIMGWRRERGGAWTGFFPFKRRCRGRSHFPFSSSSGGGGERRAGVRSRVRSRAGTRAGRAFRRLLGCPCRRAPLFAGRPVGPRPQLLPGAAPSPCPGGRRTVLPPPPPDIAPESGRPAGPRSPGRRSAPAPAPVPGERRPLAACEPDFPGPAPRPRPGDRALPRRCPPPPAPSRRPRPAPRSPAPGGGAGAAGSGAGLPAPPSLPLPFVWGLRRRRATLACLSGRGGVSPGPARQVWAGELGTAGSDSSAAVRRTGPCADRLLPAAAR